MIRVPPPVLMVAAALAQRAWTPAAAAPSRVRSSAAVVLAAGSVALAGTAAGRFRSVGTTVEPFHPDQSSSLVTTGANAVTRNPMYVGMAGLLVAHAAHRGSWRALVPAALFVTVIDLYQVTFEEHALLERFGADYRAYRASVPRWLDARSLRLPLR